MSAINRHATAVIIADRGILIMGASGSGKTTLTLTLVRQAAVEGRFARLVADDQVFLSCGAARLLARAPATIAAVVEVRGLGPSPIHADDAAVIDLAVSLEIPDKAPRMREPQRFEFESAGVDQIVLPERNSIQSALAVAAWFGWPPFSPR